MSRETSIWLNRNVLIGFTEKRGNVWHYRASDQGDEPNHYPGAIPVADVERRLFNFEAESRRVAVEVPCDVSEATHVGEDGTPAKWAVQYDRQAIAADDDNTVFGLFKAGYQAHQYRAWLLDTVANILDDELNVSSAGLLSNRANAWVEVSVPENIMGPAGIEFRPNLIACTSFDGTLATTFKRTITETVCDNTRDMALSEKGQAYKTRHSKYSGMKLGAARDALNIIHTMSDDFIAELESLVNQKVSDTEFTTVLDALIPIDADKVGKRGVTLGNAKRERITAMYRNDTRVAPWTGTAFGVVQAFNTWEHHEKSARAGTIRAERNMLNALNGTTAKADAEVMRVLAAL